LKKWISEWVAVRSAIGKFAPEAKELILAWHIFLSLILLINSLRIIGMNKETIKVKLLEGLKQGPYMEDVRWAALFGSHVNGTATDSSDVDVLIDFEPTAVIGFFALSDMKHNFESFMGKTVDILTPEAISKYFRDEVLAQAECIYEK